MARRFIKTQPDTEGWYFWRRDWRTTDPFYWESYFIEGDKELSCWENGVEVQWSSGGEWSLVE